MTYPIRVAIVGAGRLSGVDYRAYAESLVVCLNHEKVTIRLEEVQKFDVQVVESAEEALKGHLRAVNFTRRLIFLSIYFREEANKIARETRGAIKVCILTGSPPADEALIVPKGVVDTAGLSRLLG